MNKLPFIRKAAASFQVQSCHNIVFIIKASMTYLAWWQLGCSSLSSGIWALPDQVLYLSKQTRRVIPLQDQGSPAEATCLVSPLHAPSLSLEETVPQASGWLRYLQGPTSLEGTEGEACILPPTHGSDTKQRGHSRWGSWVRKSSLKQGG